MNISVTSVWARSTALALVLVLMFGPAGSALAEGSAASSSPLAATSSPATASPRASSGGSASSTPLNAAVVTGGAASTAQTEQQVNTSVVQTASATPGMASASIATAPTATSSPSVAATSTPTTATTQSLATTTPVLASSSPPVGASGTTTVAVLNTASTTATTTAAAQTGANAANGGNGGALVATGNAYASGDAINVINTNIVDSTGLLYFANLFSALGINLGNLDLSYFTSSSTPTCTESSCNPLSVYAQNAATTTNTVDVVASTGGNSASSTGSGSSGVYTGNAYASGNAVNIINSNFVRSNYLLVALNDFGNLGGDIVLPDATFFHQLLAQSAGATGPLSLSTSNGGSVANSTTAVAQTGGNTATSTNSGSSLVSTGAGLSSATSFNQVSTNLVGGTTVFLLFRIWGNWTGSVRGLPPGMTWAQTPAGLEITNTQGDPVSGAALAPSSALLVNATNTAALTNRVSVYALTGNNQAQAAAGTSTIATGNAYASANSVNVVNTNLVGHNWIYAIFNIFGNMTGDISFGQPNLWIGAAAQASNPTLPDTNVPFTFTVTNRGTATATDVQLSTNYLAGMLHFATGSSTAATNTWQLGSLAPGQTKVVTVDAVTGYVPQGGSAAVPVTATVSSAGHDANPADNTDSLTIVVSSPPAPGSKGPTFSSGPLITVTPAAQETATTAPAVLPYAALVANNGGTAFDAVATDVIRDAEGAVVSSRSWSLGNLAYNDELRISYTAAFASSTAPGEYTNVMTVTGHMHYPDGIGSVSFTPVSATSTFSILPHAVATLASTPVQSCAPYLSSYLKPGGANDPAQVRKLQTFLIDQGVGSGVSVNGAFDAATESAVKAFQAKFAANVLGPWGYSEPTGDVYYTTELQINALACAGRGTFALTQAQREEVNATRSLIAQLRARAVLAHATSAGPVSNSNASTTVHTVSAPAKEPEATSTDVTLPPNLEVGMGTGDASGLSWFGGITRAPSLVVASVASAYRAVLATFGLQ